jgi:hypothetical protein
VKFSFIAKHRGIWAVDWMCGALGVSRGGFDLSPEPPPKMGRVHTRWGMDMKPSRFTEEQIIGILREQEAGAKAVDVCREHGASSATFYKWKAK